MSRLLPETDVRSCFCRSRVACGVSRLTSLRNSASASCAVSCDFVSRLSAAGSLNVPPRDGCRLEDDERDEDARVDEERLEEGRADDERVDFFA